MSKINMLFIEGNISSGKSTLMNALRKHSNLCNGFELIFIDEPVRQWLNVRGYNILEWFYNNQEHASFPFEIFASITRATTFINTLLKVLIENDSEKRYIIVSERSLWTQMACFVNTENMENELKAILLESLEILTNIMKNIPTIFCYITTTPEICYRRKLGRAREGEDGITLEYLQTIDGRHKIYFDTEYNNVSRPDNYTIYTINNTTDYTVNSGTIMGYNPLQEILSIINSL